MIKTVIVPLVIAVVIALFVIAAVVVYACCVVAGCADEACSSNILFITYKKKRCISRWNRKRRSINSMY